MEVIDSQFKLISTFSPNGDQAKAIEQLANGLSEKEKTIQTLLGVTGSGKTFTVANVIGSYNKNTLIISPNKTLATQLYSEFKEFFPSNNVGYFVSFYDYYQPESYIPQSDTYIEKDTNVNETIEKMRLEATAMLMSGEPTIIVSTVSCIYSLGSPMEWDNRSISLYKGYKTKRSEIIHRLIESRYERNDVNLIQGNFRVRGEFVDIFPSYLNNIIRIELNENTINNISIYEPVTMRKIKDANNIKIFPAKHYVINEKKRNNAIMSIRTELKEWITHLDGDLERERLISRTNYDLEMLEELGYCSGIENYSRHFDGRNEGEPPYCLLDFFEKDFLIVIDESHVTLPQLRGMFNGDHTRKKSLVEYGFRLPSAFDNRPLKFDEFEKYLNKVIYVSATPGNYELSTSIHVVEQLVRPTGLIEPKIEIRQSKNQINDLISEVKSAVKKDQRILVTTLTKRMAEDLAEYLAKKDIKVRYMHSEIEGLERTELIRQLRLGEFDVMVGINLLREGLDIPEVSLVAIVDADKEGFLRNEVSLIQTFGRAARNIEGKVIMYCEKITKSMRFAVQETERRRKKQIEYNINFGITPKSIIKPLSDIEHKKRHEIILKSMSKKDLLKLSIETESTMKKWADQLDFEKAIEYRDKLKIINQHLGITEIL
ncbi:MAG: excinuclease ABC subunit UvrB [Nitrososphaeraceae archaeon]